MLKDTAHLSLLLAGDTASIWDARKIFVPFIAQGRFVRELPMEWRDQYLRRPCLLTIRKNLKLVSWL